MIPLLIYAESLVGYHKRGGLRWLRLGRMTVSWCRRRA